MINKGNTEDILKEYGLKNDQLFAILLKDIMKNHTFRNFAKLKVKCPLCGYELNGGSLKKHFISHKKKYIKQVKKLSNIITLPNEINPDRMIVNILKTYPLNDLGNLGVKNELIDINKTDSPNEIDNQTEKEGEERKIKGEPILTKRNYEKKGFIIKNGKIISNMKKQDILNEITLNIKRFEYYFSLVNGKNFIYDKTIDLDNEEKCEYKFKRYNAELKKKNKQNENNKKDINEKVNLDNSNNHPNNEDKCKYKFKRYSVDLKKQNKQNEKKKQNINGNAKMDNGNKNPKKFLGLKRYNQNVIANNDISFNYINNYNF